MQPRENANSAVMHKGISVKWFPMKTGVRQGPLLSPTLFNIFLEDIMNDVLSNHTGSLKINGRNIKKSPLCRWYRWFSWLGDELIHLTEYLF